MKTMQPLLADTPDLAKPFQKTRLFAGLSGKRLVRQGHEPLQYYIGGAGQHTLAIINAYGQSLAFWDLLVADLVTRYRVVIWQPRGAVAMDGAVHRAYSVDDHVRDMRGIFQTNGIERAHLIGWHTGPKTAASFYARHPGNVASMTFMNACFTHNIERRPPTGRYEQGLFTLCKLVEKRPELADKVIDALRGVLQSQEPSQVLPGREMTGPESDLISHIKSLVFEPFSTPQSVLRYAAQMLEFWKHDISSILPTVKVPVLFLDGQCDYIADPVAAKSVAAITPGATHARVRGATHYMQCDNHRSISRILACFIERQDLTEVRQLLLDPNATDAGRASTPAKR